MHRTHSDAFFFAPAIKVGNRRSTKNMEFLLGQIVFATKNRHVSLPCLITGVSAVLKSAALDLKDRQLERGAVQKSDVLSVAG